VNVVIETDRQINSSRYILRNYVTQKVMMYILQFNDNTEHKFRWLHCYISFPVCLRRTKWPFM